MAMQKKGLIAITVQVCESTVKNDCQTAVLTHFYLDKKLSILYKTVQRRYQI